MVELDGGANVSLTLRVGDTVEFVGDHWYLVAVPEGLVPEGFKQVRSATGWAFEARKENVVYPYANFTFGGAGGKVVTVSVVVYG